MKKVILYLVDYPLDIIGGAQGSTLEIAKALDFKRFRPVIATPYLEKQIDIGKEIKVIEYNNDFKNIFKNILVKINIYRKIIKDINPDIIHIQMPLSAIVILILKVVNMIPNRTKIFFTDREILDKYSSKVKFLFKLLAFRIDRIICTTNINAKLWRSYIENKDKVITIGNMVSDKFGEYDKNKFKRNNSGINIGFVGRITQVKNWGLAYDICKSLHKKIDMNVFCATSAFSSDEVIEQKEMHEKFVELLSSDKYKFFIDLTQQQISEFYYNIDILIITSDFESFGKTAIEAMSRNCIVITTDNYGTPEVIDNPNFVFDKNDIDGITKKVIELYNNKELLEKEKNNMYVRYLKNYDRRIIIEKHEALYEEV